MRVTIENFPKQFEYKPEIVNAGGFEPRNRFIVAGMGGSNLAADLLKIWKPELDIIVHRNYGLPYLEQADLKQRLFVASSYSGNTEETLDAFEQAMNQRLAIIAIGTGGKLLELAKENLIPYIELPNLGIQPRMALGFQIKAIAEVFGLDEALKKLTELVDTLDPLESKDQAEKLASKLKGRIPIIYSSWLNKGIAYNWKVKLNETAKIPAFFNTFPELNHNEMAGFGALESARHLFENFHFIFIRDNADHPRIIKRMDVLERLYNQRGFAVENVVLRGETVFHKIFSSLILADWLANDLAKLHGAEPELVPLVEEFKNLIS